jgi:hypothetical protein
MPDVQQILQGLATITNHFTAISIAWHSLFLVLFIALISGWRPTNRLLSLLLSLPAFSVCLFAIVSNNLFNGLLFLVIGILLFVFGFKASREPVKISFMPFRIAGIIMILFGFIYPHFLDAKSFISYFYSAPTGLIPCPTLSIIAGFALLFEGFLSKGWSVTLITAGLFYSLFGIFRLHVILDTVLLAGMLIFLIQQYFFFKT